MTDVRDAVAYNEIAAVYVTYKIDGVTIVYDATKKGGAATTMLKKAVTLSADDTVALIADGQAIEGKLILVEADGKATVQVGGYMTLPKGNGATVTRGKKLVGALGAGAAKGYIREVATGTAAELGVARGRTINNATDAAIVVHLPA